MTTSEASTLSPPVDPPPVESRTVRAQTPHRELWGDGAWLLVNRIACAAAVLLGTRLVTEYLAPSVYGQYTLAFTAIFLFANLCATPVSQAIARYYPELVHDGRTAALRRLFWPWYRQFALLTAVLLGAWAALRWTRGESLLLPLLAACGVAILVRREIEASLLNAARRHRLFGVWEFFESCARPLSLIAAAFLLGHSVESLLIGQLGAVALMAAGVIWLTRDSAALGPSDTDAPAPGHDWAADIRSFMWPILPLPLLAAITEMGDRYALGWLGSFAEVGMYAVVYTLMSQPFMLVGRVAHLTFAPVYYQAAARRDEETQSRTFRSWLAAVSGIGLIGCVAVWELDHLVGRWLLAPDYRDGVALMIWIALGNALLVVARVFEAPLQAQKRTGRVLACRVVAAVAAVATMTPLIYWYGAWGAAVACPIYFGVQCLTAALLARSGGKRQPHELFLHYYPEARATGYSRVDGSVAFYDHVNAAVDRESVVLDVGCGRGAFADDPVAARRELRNFRGRCRRVIGLDVDPNAAENPYLDEFQLLTSAAWPLADASVDVVVADYVVEHLADPDAFWAEAARVLRPGGRFCLRTPNAWGYVAWAARLIPNRWHGRVVQKVQDARQAIDVFPTYYRCNTPGKLHAALQRRGFAATVVGHEAEPSYLAFSPWLYRLGVMYQRYAPRRFANVLFVFATKPAVRREKE